MYLDCSWGDPVEQGPDPAFLELRVSDVDPAREVSEEDHDHDPP